MSRTSAVLEHSVAGTITTAQAIIIAVGKPLMAKLADVYVNHLAVRAVCLTITVSGGARLSSQSPYSMSLDM